MSCIDDANLHDLRIGLYCPVVLVLEKHEKFANSFFFLLLLLRFTYYGDGEES